MTLSNGYFLWQTSRAKNKNAKTKNQKLNRNRECHQRVGRGEAGDARRGEILVRDETKQDTRDM